MTSLQERIANLSNADLLSMSENAVDYLPDANAIAKLEVERRGGISYLRNQVALERQIAVAEADEARLLLRLNRKRRLKETIHIIVLLVIVSVTLAYLDDRSPDDRSTWSERMSTSTMIPGTNIIVNGWFICGLPLAIGIFMLIHRVFHPKNELGGEVVGKRPPDKPK